MSTHDDDTCPHFVRANLHASLKAEFDLLKIDCWFAEAENANLQDENARLKAAFHLLDESIKLGPSAIPLSPGYYVWKESEQYDLKAENARLKAEVERLTAFTTRTIIPNEELQAQVERLTKAGDELIHGLAPGGSEYSMNENIERWNAAKEGKPSA